MLHFLFFAFIFVFTIFAGQKPALTYVFVHGLGESGESAAFYVKGNSLEKVKVETDNGIKEMGVSFGNSKNFHILDKPIHHFNFPCAPEVNLKINKNGGLGVRSGNRIFSNKVSLGQKFEIEALKNELSKISGSRILFGKSMGAASIINCLATYQPKNIKAIVLEAPFDTVERVVNNKAGIFSWIGLGSLVRSFIYPEYDSKGIKPINVISKIDKNIPLIFIHSKKDDLIPVRSSRKLYCELKKCGHKKVHLFELNDAGHNDATISNDAYNYQCVVHAFYRKYELPHDPSLADAGQPLFIKTQPSILEAKYDK